MLATIVDLGDKGIPVAEYDRENLDEEMFSVESTWSLFGYRPRSSVQCKLDEMVSGVFTRVSEESVV